jgi:hypothetical protein
MTRAFHEARRCENENGTMQQAVILRQTETRC